MKLACYQVDLHIHSVASACAEVEMIPPLIVRRAADLGLNLIAITDHNSADNVRAVWEAAHDTGIAVLPGMEVQTREEAHILCIFDRLDQATSWHKLIDAHLPRRRNVAEVFGAQFVVDAEGELLRIDERLLATSVDLSVEEVVQGARDLGGIAIAAHVDRPGFSLLANLGFVPEGLALTALELTPWTDPEAFIQEHPELACWPLSWSSDAHRLGDMRVAMHIQMVEPSIEELELAFKGIDGRRVAPVSAHCERYFS